MSWEVSGEGIGETDTTGPRADPVRGGAELSVLLGLQSCLQSALEHTRREDAGQGSKKGAARWSPGLRRQEASALRVGPSIS